jgi:hypothetical protein
VDILVDLSWQCWILPASLVVVWTLLWFLPGRSRLRMWYAGLAPLVAVAGIVLGIVTLASGGDPADDSCGGPSSCAGTGDAAHWANGLASISDLGVTIIANSVLGGAVSVVLLIITAAVDLPRLAAAKADQSG